MSNIKTPNKLSSANTSSKSNILSNSNPNNINHNNVKPFIDKINFDISDVLSNDNTGLPLIPGIYFVQKTFDVPDYITYPPSSSNKNGIYDYDNIGTQSITRYYNIKNCINKLETIKNFIIDILKDNKKLFDTIKISQKKYNLTKKNLFFDFKEKMNDNFIPVFGDNKNNINKLTKFKNQKNANLLGTSLKFSKISNKGITNMIPGYNIGLKKGLSYITISKPYIRPRNKDGNLIENPAYFYKNKDVKKITFYLLIRAFIKNNYNLLKINSKSKSKSILKINNKNNKPDDIAFMKIFQQEFNRKSKSYFYKLFQEYNKTRQTLIKYIKSDYGILAFDFMFDIKYKLNTKYTTVNPDQNIEDYKIIDKETKINSTSNRTVGDILYKSGNKIGYIYDIDFSESKPYTVKLYSNNNNNTTTKKMTEDEIKAYSTSTKKIEPTLQEKIHNFNLMYKNIISQDNIVANYKKNIDTIYSDFYKSINNFLNNTDEYNLFNIITNNLEFDINLFKFIFNYVDIGVFNKAVGINFKIKKYINNKINDFESKYESYILLFNQINGVISKNDFLNDTLDNLDFEKFLNGIIENLQTGTNSNSNLNNITNKIVNSYSKANININTDAFAKLRKNLKKLHTLIIKNGTILIEPPSVAP
jgi:hypothetical protein